MAERWSDDTLPRSGVNLTAAGLTCTLAERDGVRNCHGLKDCSECRRCGWEAHERQRRRELLRTEGVHRDPRTGLACLLVRHEREAEGNP